MIQEVKKTWKDVLVLDSGNLLCSKKVKPFLSSLQQKEVLLNAQLIVEAFNSMGCDAGGIGGDDLRVGTKTFAKMKKMADFPFVSANVVTQRGRPVSVPSVVKKVGGLRWGIFSLMSANPPLKAEDRDWNVLDPVSTGKKVVKELQRKADIIVLLAAMPLRELRSVLSQVSGITCAVVGDNPSGLSRPLQVGHTIVVSSNAYGRYLGVLTLSLRDPTAPFIDEARIIQLKQELDVLEAKVKQGKSESFVEQKQEVEADLKALQQNNSYRNERIRLSSKFREDQKVNELVSEFRAQMQELDKGCSAQ